MKKLVAFMSSLVLVSASVPVFPANADYYDYYYTSTTSPYTTTRPETTTTTRYTTTYPYITTMPYYSTYSPYYPYYFETSTTSYTTIYPYEFGTTAYSTTSYTATNSSKTSSSSSNTNSNTPPSIKRSLPSNAILYDNFYYINHDNYIEIWGVTDQTVTEITIPSQISGLPVTTIANSAFYGCTALTSITIPDSVTSIGTPVSGDELILFNGVFAYCTSLQSVYIPDSVTYIGDAAFYGCANLTSVHLPANIKELPSGWDGAWGYYGFFGNCTSLKTVVIPETVETIDRDAFFGCSALTSIVIPENVFTIEAGAFIKCDNLTSVTIKNQRCTFGEFTHNMAGVTNYVFSTIGDIPPI